MSEHVPPPVPVVRPRRIVLRMLLTIAAVAAIGAGLVGAWYAQENYRGRRVWIETRRKLEARGESLDAAHFIPPPVPDDQNFAMAPLFKRLYQYEVDPVTKVLTFGQMDATSSEFVEALPFGKLREKPAKPGNLLMWDRGSPLDLAPIQQFYRDRPDFAHTPAPRSSGEDVLLALTRFDADLAEIARDAADRPLSRWPTNWTQSPAWSIRLPQYNFILHTVQTLRLRASAKLACERTDDAFADLRLCLRLTGDASREHVLIPLLVSITCLGAEFQPLWEGLVSHRWSAAQLAEIQDSLQRVDLLRDYLEATRTERAVFVVPSLDSLRKLGVSASVNDGSFSRAEKAISRAYPSGWADWSVALTCERMQSGIIDCLDPSAHRVLARQMERQERDFQTVKPSLNSALAKIIVPVNMTIASKTARAQTYVDEAIVACALERYFLDHRTYPQGLDTLVPDYLPRVPPDVISGVPLHYETTAAGRYRLWGVGWDGTDDGGKVAWKGSTKPTLDEKHGDWVWQYEPVSPP